MRDIKNVAVLGAGVMGSQIAAHCANAGLNVYAFDMNQQIVEEGIEKERAVLVVTYISNAHGEHVESSRRYLPNGCNH